jgi:hypothetical protein
MYSTADGMALPDPTSSEARKDPGGLNAREYEGSRLNERDRQRQELVFEERERLDTLRLGQFVDQSRQELLDAHGSPLPRPVIASDHVALSEPGRVRPVGGQSLVTHPLACRAWHGLADRVAAPS